MIAAAALFAPPLMWRLYGAGPKTASDEIAVVIESYVKAIYSRDFASAYATVSERDRSFKSQKTYVSEQGAFSGFASQVARRLAGWIELHAVKPFISGDQASVTVKVHLPDPNKIAPLVLNWDEARLNGLSTSEQTALLSALEARRREGRIAFIEAQEKFDLVKENSSWKLFFNWRMPVQVEVRTKLPQGTSLQVEPVARQIEFQPGEPFTITIRLRNPSTRELRARVMHNVEPKSLEKYLGVGDCGNYVPFRIGAGKQDENSSTFLVWTNLPPEVKRFAMIYEFEVD